MINGSQNPIVGTDEIYTLVNYSLGLAYLDTNPQYTWHIKRLYGEKWIDITKEPQKTGLSVPFNFGPHVVGEKFLLEVYKETKNIFTQKNETHKMGELQVIPASGKVPKITKVVLFNRGARDVNKASYTDKLVARAYCVGMFNKTINFHLWEDDAAGGGHNAEINKNNRINKSYPARVNVNGIAEAEISLSADQNVMKQVANRFMMHGDTNEGAFHEFYVTASYDHKILGANQTNVDVANPDYKKPQPKSSTPQKTNIPSPKQPQQEESLMAKSINFIVDNVINVFTPEKTKTANSVGKQKPPQKSTEGKCFCNRDFTLEEIKEIIKQLRISDGNKNLTDLWYNQQIQVNDKTVEGFRNEINANFEKFKIKSCAQKMHILAQAAVETGAFSLSREKGHKDGTPFDYDPWRGHGLLQLTLKSAYEKYAIEVPNINAVKNPQKIAEDLHLIIHSGCWEWSEFKKAPDNLSSEFFKKWDKETAGKSLNQLAEYGDKYLELISALLNGRNKTTDMPNGWTERQTAYNLLKNFIFKYDYYHGNKKNEPINADGIVTYHIYGDNRKDKIEKHIPKEIKSEYKQYYKYIYHDKNNKEHDICSCEWHLTKEKMNGTKPGKKPVHSKIIEDKYVNEGQTDRRIKYENGDIAEHGINEGVTFWVLYKVSGNNIQLVKMPDLLNYNSNGVVIKYKFAQTQRRYTDPDHMAVFIGALADCGFSDVRTTGSCFREASCFPSVEHVNGKSIDTQYLDDAREQQLINAFHKFGITKQLRGSKKKAFNHTSNGKKLHNSHLHSGIIADGTIKIKRE